MGYPLAHSLSPRLHAAALSSVGLTGNYRLFPISPGEFDAGIGGLLARMKGGEIHGINVTLPYKQSVLEHMDSLGDDARASGSVNTIWVNGSVVWGDNTDTAGFLTDLERAWPGLQPGQSIILGTGGAAVAVAWGLLQRNWHVTLIGRDLQTIRFSPRLQGFQSAGALSLMSWQSLTSGRLPDRISLLVNATPIGMHPGVANSPWPGGVPLPAGSHTYDLVYNPETTRLVRDARMQGHEARSGLGMLIEQAALGFERWTGRSPDREEMLKSVTASGDGSES